MRLKKRLSAGILAVMLIVSSLQIPGGTVQATELLENVKETESGEIAGMTGGNPVENKDGTDEENQSGEENDGSGAGGGSQTGNEGGTGDGSQSGDETGASGGSQTGNESGAGDESQPGEENDGSGAGGGSQAGNEGGTNDGDQPGSEAGTDDGSQSDSETGEDDGLVTGATRVYFESETDIPLHDGMFDHDSTCFSRLTAGSLSIVEKETGRRVSVGIEGYPYVLMWSAKGPVRYVCIEPWHGLPDARTASGIWEEKPDTVRLAPGESWSTGLAMTFAR